MDTSFALPVSALDAVMPQVDRCARHGLPSARRVDFALQSRPKLTESNPALGGNVLATAGRVGEHAGKVRVTRIAGWPLCARCVRTRRWWLLVASVCFWGGLALLAGAIVARIVAGQSAVLGIPMIGGIVLAIASPAPFVLASLPRITKARTSDDGGAVLVRDAHPEFAAQVRATVDRLPQHPG
ncbi:hypothetical protein ACFP2T_20395 [Plantactinospora solaniradicis]|uniref:Uncharacterized protein n=1 Tax=Plantactinospora solaniradicis TaxID=1723736 RepID=A0ABW1KBD1_9ACTN